MCGIFGIVTEEEQNLGNLLIEAGKRLSYRGYDSVGCATLNRNQVIDLRKDVGKVDEVADKLHFRNHSLRWAVLLPEIMM